MPDAANSKIQKSFDYNSLDADTSEFVQQQTGEIRVLLKQTGENIINTGQKLLAVKDKLQHGQFIDWLQTELGLHRNTANRFMHVAKEFGCLEMSQIVTFDLTALYQLATPSTPQAARDEAIDRAKAGEVITYSTAKEIKQKYSRLKPKASQSVKLEKVDQPQDLSPQLNIPSEENIAVAPKKSTSPPQQILTIVSRQSEIPLARTTLPIPSQTKEIKAESSSSGTWWQLDGNHLLFCGDPNSLEFRQRLPQQITLLLAFPASTTWLPAIEAQNRIIISDLPSDNKWNQLEEVVEPAILYWWKKDSLVVSCFVPSVDLFVLLSRLSCRGVLAEPNEKHCRQLISDWRKIGGKIQPLASTV